MVGTVGVFSSGSLRVVVELLSVGAQQHPAGDMRKIPHPLDRFQSSMTP